MPIRGVIFDLDGTLIDSRLDFDQMRCDMEFAPGQLILETLEALPEGERKKRCREILHRHEYQGATSAGSGTFSAPIAFSDGTSELT